MALAQREGPVLGRLHLTERAIEERVGRTALVSIPRADARNLVVRRATVAERPLFFSVTGAALAVVGAIALLSLLQHPTGPLLIAAGLRRGWVLEIETARGARKLGFGKGVGELEVKAFLADAASAGVFIDRR